MKLIKNAQIQTMEGQDYDNGYIIVDGCHIHSLGAMTDLSVSDDTFAEVYDAEGAMALPGFVDAHCHVGMWAEGDGIEGSDGNEMTGTLQPQLRAIDSINPADPAFAEALAAGVTTAVTGPGSGNVVGGQFAAIKTYGRWVDEMVILAPAAMKAALGENPKKAYRTQQKAPITRMATAAILREALYNAREYVRQWDEYEKNATDRPKPDFRMDALADVIRGKIPLKVHAHRADDICTAIRIGEEFGISVALEHCTEGHLIIPLLVEKKLPITIGPTFGSRSKPEIKNKTFAIYKTLEEAGIPFAIMTDHPEIPLNQLYLCAALACQSGISPRTALAAITINAAKNAGIDKRVGSLKPGKDADIVILAGTLFSLDAKIKAVFLNGTNRL